MWPQFIQFETRLRKAEEWATLRGERRAARDAKQATGNRRRHEPTDTRRTEPCIQATRRDR